MIGKEAMKYQVDSFGNWTEKKSLGWDPKMTSKSDQLLSITKRVISYY
jgi:hypothetical protein